jgi:hypothetical protein
MSPADLVRQKRLGSALLAVMKVSVPAFGLDR